MSKDELSVRLCEQPVGKLFRSGPNMRFTYDPLAQRPLSMSMPVRGESYGNRYCEAFFGGLLPESSKARMLIGQLFDVNPNNSFNLLAAIGYDCAGAVSIQNQNAPVAPTNSHKIKGEPLDEHALASHLLELPRRPLLAHLGELRVSLAGAQDKAALCMIKNQLCLPRGDSPSTHILKPPIAQLDGSVQNEYFCLKLAEVIGIPAAKVQVRRALKVTYLLVERYDREILGPNTVKRIHQEDFCQATATVSTSKYQVDGGPTLKRCFELLDEATSPAVSRKQLLDLVIFNYLVGNADAHAKNFAFLYDEHGTIKLAPAYDILCTRIYKGTTGRMAMAIGGEDKFDEIRKKNWETFCKQNRLSFSGFKDRCGEIIEMMVRTGQQERKTLADAGFDHEAVSQIVSYVKESTKVLRNQLSL